MTVIPWCPVDRAIGSYKIISRDSLMKLVRMNWRMVVLEIVASARGPMTYSSIAMESGLSSRTLSLILKELTGEKLLDRKRVPGHSPHAEYSATVIGRRIATMPCPILRLASDGRKPV